MTVTERYAHLRPDLFKSEDLLKLSVGMSREGGAVIDLGGRRVQLGRKQPGARLTRPLPAT